MLRYRRVTLSYQATLGAVLCLARRLPVLVWLAVPLAFVTAVLGLTGAAGLVTKVANAPLALSSALFGASAAVTLATGSAVRWRGGWPWRLFRWLYPLLVLLAGLPLDGMRVPTMPSIAVGLPVTALLTLTAWRYRDRPDDVPDDPPRVATRRNALR